MIRLTNVGLGSRDHPWAPTNLAEFRDLRRNRKLSSIEKGGTKSDNARQSKCWEAQLRLQFPEVHFRELATKLRRKLCYPSRQRGEVREWGKRKIRRWGWVHVCEWSFQVRRVWWPWALRCYHSRGNVRSKISDQTRFGNSHVDFDDVVHVLIGKILEERRLIVALTDVVDYRGKYWWVYFCRMKRKKAEKTDWERRYQESRAPFQGQRNRQMRRRSR